MKVNFKALGVAFLCGSAVGLTLFLLSAPQSLAVTIPAAVSAGAYVGLNK